MFWCCQIDVGNPYVLVVEIEKRRDRDREDLVKLCIGAGGMEVVLVYT
jgi:hypothetical protein